ncbi:hypothetical protein GCM10011574_39000 [Microbispora bryophytorum]|uniref:Uncharacterized protein n=1 Tax=Microbispora bryophytorum TaxID=1460882 RepID=A0A8H9LC06_9ACTN|nr:hypothetical protein GCM10011574_39000 [Microbispora bryophytorum]
MPLAPLTKPVPLSRAWLAVVVVVALFAGGFIATRLPFGTVPLRVAEGHAFLTSEGKKGAFQADNGVSSSFYGNVVWTDAGQPTVGGRPSCLWDKQTNSPRPAGARVEAGYRWVRTPDGVSLPIVAWLKCL